MERIRYRHIRKKVKELAKKIDAPANLLPTYRFSAGDALPLIEIDKQGKLHYARVERGEEFERRMTENLDELLYWIFSGITTSMAFEYELKNRIEDKDCRRIAFDKQIELLSVLNENWSKKEHEEHLQILKNHPFDDLAGLRATYYRIAYLAAKILVNDLSPITYYEGQDMKDLNIENPDWNFLNRLKRQPDKSSFYYWYQAVELLKV